MDDDKLKIAVIHVLHDWPNLRPGLVKAFILADWPRPEHQAWLETASAREIANWVLACLRICDADELGEDE